MIRRRHQTCAKSLCGSRLICSNMIPQLRGGTGYCARTRASRQRCRPQADAEDHRRAGPFDLPDRSWDSDRRRAGIERWRRLGYRLPAPQSPRPNRRRTYRQGRRHQDLQEDWRSRREGRAALSHLCLRSLGIRSCGGRRKVQSRLSDRRAAIVQSRDHAVSEVIIQSLPSGASDARRLASRLGVAAAEIAHTPVSGRGIECDRCAGSAGDHHLCAARSAK